MPGMSRYRENSEMTHAHNEYYITQEQKDHANTWLVEWNAGSIYPQSDSEDESTEDEEVMPEHLQKEAAGLIKQCDAHGVRGELVMLSPKITSSMLPHYAVIATDPDENGDVFLIPCSRFSHPCVLGELKTNDTNIGLEVLQVWNTRNPHVSILTDYSWHVDMRPDLLEDAMHLLEWISFDDKELPEHVKKKTGAPVLTDDDPRLDYQDIEETMLRPLENEIDSRNEIDDILYGIIESGGSGKDDKNREDAVYEIQPHAYEEYLYTTIPAPAAADDKRHRYSPLFVCDEQQLPHIVEAIKNKKPTGLTKTNAEMIDFSRQMDDDTAYYSWKTIDGIGNKAIKKIVAADNQGHIISGNARYTLQDDTYTITLKLPHYTLAGSVQEPEDAVLFVVI